MHGPWSAVCCITGWSQSSMIPRSMRLTKNVWGSIANVRYDGVVRDFGIKLPLAETHA